MSKSEKIREQIGWLKVVFGLLFATDISLIAYLFNNVENLSVLKEMLVLLALAVVTAGIYVTNREAMKKIDELEDV